MMTQIYGNDFGMAFYWNRTDEVKFVKIQLVFKETGFHLSLKELEIFSGLISESLAQSNKCKDCHAKENCNRFLLRTPAKQIDLAVSILELAEIKDLVEGTIFNVKLQNYIYGIGRN